MKRYSRCKQRLDSHVNHDRRLRQHSARAGGVIIFSFFNSIAYLY